MRLFEYVFTISGEVSDAGVFANTDGRDCQSLTPPSRRGLRIDYNALTPDQLEVSLWQGRGEVFERIALPKLERGLGAWRKATWTLPSGGGDDFTLYVRETGENL